MAVIRVLAGLIMALFGAAFYGIGLMFTVGNPENPAYGLAFGVFGLGGIYLPVVLCGLHLMIFGGERPVWSRALMVGLLVLVLAAACLAMLPYAVAAPPSQDARDALFGALVMSALFGWPLVRGLFQALMARKG
jgi:hypothetical protein